jgi:gingipain R
MCCAYLLILASTGNAQISLVEQRGLDIFLQFDLPSYTISNEVVNGTMCASINVPEAGTPLEKGEPALPFYSRSVAIGNNDDVSIEIVSAQYKEIAISRIIPSKGNFSRNINPDDIPYEFGNCYTRNTWIPQTNAALTPAFIIRDIRGVTVNFHPFQYNPVLGRLKIAQSIQVKITSKGVSRNNVLSAAAEISSPSFENIYATRFINYPAIASKYEKIADGENMIVIAAEKFANVIKPLVDWKNQKGIRTKLYLYPKDIGGSGEAAIKTFITNKYTSDKITYVLLVGEHVDVPALLQSDASGKGPGDALYSLISGNDLYADLFVGRLSSSNESEIQVMVDKILKYEKEPDMTGDWYSRCAGMASLQASSMDPGRPDITWQEEMRPVFEKYGYKFDSLYHGYILLDPAKITTVINAGLSWFNFMGHGRPNTIEFTFPTAIAWPASNILSSTNGDKQAVFISVACNNGSSIDTTCMAETWCKTKGKGGIAFLGSTLLQDWTPPQHAQKEMVNLLCADEFISLGGIIYNGKSKTVEASGATNADKTIKSWTLFGDPSLLVSSKKTQEVKVTSPANVDNGKEFEITFASKIQGRVCIYSENSGVIDAKMVNGTSAKLTATIPAGEKTVLLTVTARNVKPVQTAITVGPTALSEHPVSSSDNTFRIINANRRAFCQSISLPGDKSSIANASVAIYTSGGKKIFSTSRLSVWNCKTGSGDNVPAGIYMAIVSITYKNNTTQVLRSRIGIDK